MNDLSPIDEAVHDAIGDALDGYDAAASLKLDGIVEALRAEMRTSASTNAVAISLLKDANEALLERVKVLEAGQAPDPTPDPEPDPEIEVFWMSEPLGNGSTVPFVDAFALNAKFPGARSIRFMLETEDAAYIKDGKHTDSDSEFIHDEVVPPGTHKLHVDVFSGRFRGGVLLASRALTFTIVGDQQQPDPEPDPKPDPEPTPEPTPDPVPEGRKIINSIPGRKTPPVPQAYFDEVARQKASMRMMLQPPADAVTSVQDGKWSDPATWGGRVPSLFSNVHVAHNVEYDDFANVRVIFVSGVFRWGTTDDLVCHTLCGPGEIEIGTPENPADARIKFDINENLGMFGGLVTWGKLRIHGKPKTPWVYDVREAEGWVNGDDILVPATEFGEEDTLLTYGDVIMVGTAISHGGKALRAPIQNFTRSVQFISTGSVPAHHMHMWSDDCERMYCEFVDFGRTKVTKDGSEDLGRYAVHNHWTGQFLGRRPIITKGVSIRNTRENNLTRGYVNHSSRDIVEGVVEHGHDATGFWTETGQEIGQWTNCCTSGHKGDGSRFRESQTEKVLNAAGHVGVAYQNQARQTIMHNCWAGSSTIAFDWHQSRAIDYVDASPEHTDLRLVDPLTNGISESRSYNERNAPGIVDRYGHTQVQIARATDLSCHNCEVGLHVDHRNQADNYDVMPAVFTGWRLHCESPFRVPRYSFNYIMNDFMFVGDGGTAISFGTKCYAFSFSDGVVRGFKTLISDKEFNYGGELVEIDHDCDVLHESIGILDNRGLSLDDYKQNGIMGAWRKGDGKIYPRSYEVLKRPQLPVNRPTGKYGVWGVGTAPGLRISGGGTLRPGGVGSVSVEGVLVDSVGARPWPVFQRLYEDGRDDPVQKRRSSAILDDDIIRRNGCWKDGSDWKCTLRFHDADRATAEFFHADVTVDIQGFDEDFLKQWEGRNLTTLPLELEVV